MEEPKERSMEQVEKQIVLAQSTIKRNWEAFIRAPFNLARAQLGRAVELLAEARNAHDSELCRERVQMASDAALDSYLLALPSRAAESRGVWYRPKEQSYEEVCHTMDRMQEAGFNELYLETWFWGYTIYPSLAAESKGVENQHPFFRGWDPLDAFVKEAGKRGIAVHAWLDGFMVGIDATGGPVLRVFPEWAALSRSQSGAEKPLPQQGTGYFWLDITNPEVRDYLFQIMKEIITNYEISGVNLDFIRLPQSADDDSGDSYCFSKHARKAFEQEQGTDPLDIDANEHPEIWQVWTTWLENIEDEYVSLLYQELKSLRPNLIVSATPEPGTESEKIGHWSRSVDVVIPQAYHASSSEVRESFELHQRQLVTGNLIYTGIYPMYIGLSAKETVDQVLAARDLDDGTIIFAFGQATSPMIRALRLGPWRTPAISTGLYPRKAIVVLLEALKTDVNEVYVPRGGMNDLLASVMIRKLNDIMAISFDEGNWSSKERDSVAGLLITFSTWLGKANHEDLHVSVQKQLIQVLSQIHRLLQFAQEKQPSEANQDPYKTYP
ncbi:family 10 glycosylhydrolase [Paenibacillus sp. 5J-6]|uniref:Family 10 glycosylhydrolase n=1 Tax=Paenibacillus silvestris TaxID=2606219 RepID=A0A6L8VBK9_9BACL|nr:family 10 glycosylhydrolase [Paenibacillus silvestris]MZQ87061.1 family 10 glycosylhydrolase [Paenibacillus silvestris]